MPTKRAPKSRAQALAPSLDGAEEGPSPKFIEPNVPTLRARAPKGDQWLFEPTLDGYRAQVHLRDGKPIVFTRSGLDWTDKFPTIAEAVAKLPAANLVLDGEIIVPGPGGGGDFSLLKEDLSAKRTDRMVLYAFDVLYLDGFDLRGVDLVDRKRVLAELLKGAQSPLLYMEHLEGDGDVIIEHALRLGLEGVVAKNKGSVYRSGRGETWLKMKGSQREHLRIVGFIPDRNSVAALYLARGNDERLVYAGKVGSGLTLKGARELREKLNPLVRPKQPLAKYVKKPKAVWVEPHFEADVQYRGITSDGLLRHPSFKGVRAAKSSTRKRRVLAEHEG